MIDITDLKLVDFKTKKKEISVVEIEGLEYIVKALVVDAERREFGGCGDVLRVDDENLDRTLMIRDDMVDVVECGYRNVLDLYNGWGISSAFVNETGYPIFNMVYMNSYDEDSGSFEIEKEYTLEIF